MDLRSTVMLALPSGVMWESREVGCFIFGSSFLRSLVFLGSVSLRKAFKNALVHRILLLRMQFKNLRMKSDLRFIMTGSSLFLEELGGSGGIKH